MEEIVDKKAFRKGSLLVAIVAMGLLTVVLILLSRMSWVEITDFNCLASGKYRGMVAITYKYSFEGEVRKHGPITFWPQWGEIHTTAEMGRYHVWVNVVREWPNSDRWVALVRLKNGEDKLLSAYVAEVICHSEGPKPY